MNGLIKRGKNELAKPDYSLIKNENLGHTTTGDYSPIIGNINKQSVGNVENSTLLNCNNYYYHNEAPPELMELVMKIYQNTEILLNRSFKI